MKTLPVLHEGQDVIIRLYCDMKMSIIGKVTAISGDGIIVDTGEYYFAVSIEDIATIGIAKEHEA